MYASTSQLRTSFGSMENLLLADTSLASLEALLTECSDIIDGYIRVVVDLPLSGGSAILDNVCISLARAEIYRRYARNDIPENVEKKEAQAYKTLEKIQTKKILLTQPDEEATDYFVETSEPVVNGWVD